MAQVPLPVHDADSGTSHGEDTQDSIPGSYFCCPQWARGPLPSLQSTSSSQNQTRHPKVNQRSLSSPQAGKIRAVQL